MKSWQAGLLALCGVWVAGCADLGRTEPVLGNGGNTLNTYPEGRMLVSQPAPQATVAQKPVVVRETVDLTPVNREIAGLHADLDSLREEQKGLLNRLLALEQENESLKDQNKQLAELVAAMDQRFSEVDKGWRKQMENLSANMDRERAQRRTEMEQLGRAVSSEIERNARNAAAQQQAASTEYRVWTVQKGDTLSAIAQVSGIGVERIKQYNNLKNNNIYIGQNLKIPNK